ncbi:hypothetical protein G4228_014743 [Cervus hanglu yarkandensis]|nr:hypothetical protein G4228_014743 [Cervus hanglu yarkandensis]
MPRYTAHVRGEWLAVPCRDAQLTVGWLGREAVRRYIKNKPDNGGFTSVDDARFLVRRCKGLGLLDNEDPLEVALEDNEFVEVVIEGDAMSPDFIPSQPEGVYLYPFLQAPWSYIALDGNSLTTEDLVSLGKGHYKIKVLAAHGLKPIVLKPKEGLALINGTQMITSLGSEAVERASAIARQADIVAALTLEVLKGTTKAFDTDIHAVRPHRGQVEVAFRFRSLLDSDHHPSEIAESHRFCDRVQDAYTLRCCPQALDYLAIGVHELAAISERRIERLCNPSLSELPAFLVAEGGLNSGFMIAHCTAAALVSENKALCHPSSVDSLSTSAATEDHVSMGGWAARKALRVIEHVKQVLAIELLAACQGIEFLRPLKTTTPLEKVYDLVRSVVRPWIKDRFMAPDIEAAHRLLVEQKVWEVAAPYIEKYRMEHIPESRPVSPTAFSLEFLHKNSTKIPESEDL